MLHCSPLLHGLGNTARHLSVKVLSWWPTKLESINKTKVYCHLTGHLLQVVGNEIDTRGILLPTPLMHWLVAPNYFFNWEWSLMMKFSMILGIYFVKIFIWFFFLQKWAFSTKLSMIVPWLTLPQNFLRNQKTKTNYNLVSKTLLFLDCICGSTTGGLGLLGLYINEHNVSLIKQTLETLTEYCQGPCHENQNCIGKPCLSHFFFFSALV